MYLIVLNEWRYTLTPPAQRPYQQPAVPMAGLAPRAAGPRCASRQGSGPQACPGRGSDPTDNLPRPWLDWPPGRQGHAVLPVRVLVHRRVQGVAVRGAGCLCVSAILGKDLIKRRAALE